jgi:hypothetical protein
MFSKSDDTKGVKTLPKRRSIHSSESPEMMSKTKVTVFKLMRMAMRMDSIGAPKEAVKIVQDEVFSSLHRKSLPAAEYCYTLANKTVILLGKDTTQMEKARKQVEDLQGQAIVYKDTDRLLVDILHDNVDRTRTDRIVAVLAFIDYWPGRRDISDFGLKVKTLLPKIRTAIVSQYEAHDDLSRLDRPPIDAVIKSPLHPCVACRLVHQ